jgi:hypothetical protein
VDRLTFRGVPQRRVVLIRQQQTGCAAKGLIGHKKLRQKFVYIIHVLENKEA